MNESAFRSVMRDFESADEARQVDLYLTTEGLSLDQYKQMLRKLPATALAKLEEALR